MNVVAGSNGILLSNYTTYCPRGMISDLDETCAACCALHNTRAQRSCEMGERRRRRREGEERGPPVGLTSLWSTSSLVNSMASLLKGSAVCTPPGVFLEPRGQSMPGPVERRRRQGQGCCLTPEPKGPGFETQWWHATCRHP